MGRNEMPSGLFPGASVRFGPITDSRLMTGMGALRMPLPYVHFWPKEDRLLTAEIDLLRSLAAVRQLQMECRAMVFARRRPQLTTMLLDDGPGQREPQAGSCGLAREKRFEDLGQFFRRNADAGIAHI